MLVAALDINQYQARDMGMLMTWIVLYMVI